MNAVIYIHGKGGSALESKHYEKLFAGFDVFGLDYEMDAPWIIGEKIHKAVKDLKERYAKVVLVGNSIGAFYSMCGVDQNDICKTYFISPIVDLEWLTLAIMKQDGITEEELKSKGTIHSSFGEDVSYEILSYLRNHRISWSVPTEVLYGSNDFLMPKEIVQNFCRNCGANLTVMDGGEHWFHTDEQMKFLDDWIINTNTL